MEFFALQVLHTNPKCDINIANFDWELVFSVSELYEIFSNEFNFEITCFIHIDISFFLLKTIVFCNDSFICAYFDSTSILFVNSKALDGGFRCLLRNAWVHLKLSPRE